MMKRREFLAASGALGLLPLATAAEGNQSSDREYFELRIYHIDSQQQRDGFEYLVLKPAPCSQI